MDELTEGATNKPNNTFLHSRLKSIQIIKTSDNLLTKCFKQVKNPKDTTIQRQQRERIERVKNILLSSKSNASPFSIPLATLEINKVRVSHAKPVVFCPSGRPSNIRKSEASPATADSLTLRAEELPKTENSPTKDECAVDDSKDHILSMPFSKPMCKRTSVMGRKQTAPAKVLYALKCIRSCVILLRDKELFRKFADHLDTMEILSLLKISMFSRRRRLLNKSLKSILCKGMSTIKRIEYWKEMGRIDEHRRSNPRLYGHLQKTKSSSELAISLDVSRTYPSLDHFSAGMLGFHQLSRILKAVSLMFPKIGYCQGMNFFTALVLLIMDNEEVTACAIVGCFLDGGDAA